MAAPASGGSDPDRGRDFGRGASDELPIDVDLIKVLASDSRRDILRLLGERRRTLTELAEALGLKKATVLEHLKKLVESGLIRRLDEDDRLWIYYELTPRGLRLVRPGRTRFYLIMAGAAAAAVVLGAALVVALSNGLGPQDDAPGRSAGEEAMLDGVADASVPEVVWRGLDERATIRITDPARVNGTLVLMGGAAPLSLEVRDGVATLGASQLDALAPGTYMLSLRVGDLEARLPQAVVVRDPAVAVFPRAVVANESARLVLTLAQEASRSPPTPNVTLDGDALPLGGAAPQYTLQLPARDVGVAELQVGRLVRVPITVLPDLALSARLANGTLHVEVFDARGPVRANLTVDGAPLGEATNGSLDAPAPAQGPHVLAASAADGRTVERAIVVGAADVAPVPTRLSLSAFMGASGPSLTRIHTEVRNDGLVDEVVTLAVRDARGLIASGIVSVEPGRTAPLALDVPLSPVGTLAVDAYAANGERYGAQWNAGRSEDVAGAPVTPTTATATPAATAPTAMPTTAPSARPYAERAPDASVTLVTVTPTGTTPSASGVTEPQVPGVPAALVLALVVAVAVLLRKKAR